MKLALLVAVQLVVTSIVALSWRPKTVVVHESSTPVSLSFPIRIAAPPLPPPPPPTATTASCPPARTDAPRAAAVHPPTEVHAVTTSRTNAGWIAAWSDERVYVSIDAGVTFSQVLDGPGSVDAVTFDCFGNVVVVRDGQLGIRSGTRERWQRLPAGLRADEDDPTALIGGGPDVIVIGIASGDDWQARLAASSDRGTTWWYRDLVSYWESSQASGYQASDGSIEVALTTADCMSDPVHWVRIRDGKVETDEFGSIGAVAVHDGIVYATWPTARWKRFGDDTWHEIAGIPESAVVVGGARPHAVADGAVYRLARGRAKRIAAWNERDQASAVDPAGRIWGIRETIDGESAWAIAIDRH